LTASRRELRTSPRELALCAMNCAARIWGRRSDMPLRGVREDE